MNNKPVNSEINNIKSADEIESHMDVRALPGLINLASLLHSSNSYKSLRLNLTIGLKDMWPNMGVRLMGVDEDDVFLVPVEWTTSEPVPITGCLIGKAYIEGQPLFIEHIDDHPEYLRRFEAPPGLKWSGLIACPLFTGNRISHIIGIYGTDQDPVSESDIITLKRVAELVEPLLEHWVNHKHQLEAFLQIAKATASAVDARDPYMIGHGERVSEFVNAIARTHGLDPGFTERLSLAGLLHDIGRLGIPERILNKPMRLTPEEMGIVKAHPVLTVQFLNRVEYLSDIFPSILHHHEKYDGTGYPDGLEGDDIPLGARILAVADAFDAMTSPRPYRDPMSDREAIVELGLNSGRQFDPIIVESFIRAHKDRLILSQNVLKAEDPLAHLRTR